MSYYHLSSRKHLCVPDNLIIGKRFRLEPGRKPLGYGTFSEVFRFFPPVFDNFIRFAVVELISTLITSALGAARIRFAAGTSCCRKND
jgi:hypothetical protein